MRFIKVHIVKAVVFPAVMYGCESWIIKKAEWQKIDAFELWCWRRFLSQKEIKPVNPKGNQPGIFIGRTDAEAEAPIPWPPDGSADSLEKTLMLGKIEGRRRRGQQGMRWLDGITEMTWTWANSGRWWGTREAWCVAVHGVAKSWTWLVTENNELIDPPDETDASS